MFGKIHEMLQGPQYTYRCKLGISFSLNKEEISLLISVYSPLGSFTDTVKSGVCIQKSPKKLNIHKSVTSRKSNTRIEIHKKCNITGPIHRLSKVFSKVYLSNAKRILHEDVCKPHSVD